MALSIGAMANRFGTARQHQIATLLQAGARKLGPAFATMGASAPRG